MQGHSLDNAIIDLSDKVFNVGMAYVALSRVRTLSGLYLTSFDPKALMVSRCSIKEINRLRKIYRPDLPQYAIPKDCGTRKCKLTGTYDINNVDEPQTKKRKCLNQPTTVSSKRPLLDIKNVIKDVGNSSKKLCIDNGGSNNNNNVDDDVEEIGFNPRGTVSHYKYYKYHHYKYYKYHPHNADTWKSWCRFLNLRYVKACRLCLGSTNTVLTVPSRDIDVPGDGNCLFNALSHFITGSIEQQ